MTGSYSQVASTAAPPVVVSDLTNAQTYWFEVAGCTAGDVLGEFAGPVPCAPQSGGSPIQAEAAWQPQSLSLESLRIWSQERPLLKWYPRLPAPPHTCYQIYRSQVSTGPFSLIGTCTQEGSLAVLWIDYGTTLLHGDLYYEVTFYDAGNDFESWPSSTAHIWLP
jgi:hypothetical protein